MSRRTQFRKTPQRRVEFNPAAEFGCKCDECPLKAQPKVRPPKFKGLKLAVIEDTPFKSEEFVGQYKRNSNHAFVDHCFSGAGARDFDFTWATLCRPDGLRDKDLAKAIACCQPQVEKLTSSATHILSAGQNAFNAATPHEGSAIPWLGTPTEGRKRAAIAPAVVIPTWTPWYVRSKAGSRLAGQFLAHVDRVVRLNDGRLGEFKWPTIITELNYLPREIVDIVKAKGEVGLDLETRSTLEISCLAIAVDNTAICFQYPFSPDIRGFIQYVLSNAILVTQNGPGFDHRVLRAHGFTVSSDYNKWQDTLLGASILDPQLAKNLGALVSDEFHAPAHKAQFKLDEETGRLVGDWDSRDPRVEKSRREYCAKDAWTTLMLWKVQKERLKKYNTTEFDNVTENQ